MIVLAHQNACLPYVVAMVAGLSVDSVFLRYEDVKDEEGSDRKVSKAVIHRAHQARSLTSNLLKEDLRFPDICGRRWDEWPERRDPRTDCDARLRVRRWQ